jgi:hypothetical protein
MLKQRAQTTKPKLKNPQWAPPAHMQAPPEPMQLPLDECMWTTSRNRATATAQLRLVRPANTTGQTGAQHMNRTSTLTGQTGDLRRSDWCTTDTRNGSKPPKNLLDAFNSPKICSNFSPLLTMHESSQEMQPWDSQIDKIQHRMLHMPKWAS